MMVWAIEELPVGGPASSAWVASIVWVTGLMVFQA